MKYSKKAVNDFLAKFKENPETEKLARTILNDINIIIDKPISIIAAEIKHFIVCMEKFISVSGELQHNLKLMHKTIIISYTASVIACLIENCSIKKDEMKIIIDNIYEQLEDMNTEEEK